VVHLSSHGEIAVIGIVYKYGRPDPFLTKVHRPLHLTLLTATCAFLRVATVLLSFLLVGYVNALNSAIIRKAELVYVHVHASLIIRLINFLQFASPLLLIWNLKIQFNRMDHVVSAFCLLSF